MNFLLLINDAPRYKYFFAEIAKKIEEEGHKVFYAINSVKTKKTEPLPWIDESKQAFFFDEYMSKEQNFTINYLNDETWGDILYPEFDRFFNHHYNLDQSNEYWEKIIKGLDSFFSNLILNKEIDCILYENVSNSFAYSAYKVSKKLNRYYIGLMGSRLPNRYEIQTSIIEDELKCIDHMLLSPVTLEETNWYKEYSNSLINIQPDYMKQSSINKQKKISDFFSIKKIKKLFIYLNLIFSLDSTYDYQKGNIKKLIIAAIKQDLRKRKNEKKSSKYYLDSKKVDELLEKNERFYIYPPHYHPESSTSVLAMDYTLELNNIINIHNNLPVGTYLYVKDHISARGVQSEDFYKKISALPGVRLINFSYNVKKLIPKSLGVITINSTVGYEALILGKPVYLFGKVFYMNFPNVIKINSFLDLRRKLNKKENKQDKENIEKYIIAYKRYTYEGKLYINNPELWSDEYFRKLVENIFHRLSLVDRLSLVEIGGDKCTEN
ncbi:hypothetical protein [Acinetobacter baumannii]|uniref:capsular polysaccharide export protein, LipB/KpsS family n=1 Tax=Acinetobacter baumannii TaxID=470 RepID=UPI000707355C|nr:hypothetical protein [Acinetobacter baumannii]EHU1391457.1 capsular biosynthesis protein [Acinetobacter baumannii]EKV0072123.1 capsular biosynthesis protein [Acinetobacter baumannii]KQD44178.1 hypothetical protein APD15_05660 [Acinetobacter baumannii]MCT9184645.1 capsular biosynthesis protein [Acinetobacter baumannii]MCT9225106.1 capsular biosynthesis protein [Acinetobacter baumannii]